MDILRSHTLFRQGLLAALIGVGFYTSPLLFAADSTLFGVNLFQFFAPLLTLVLGFAALRIDCRTLRHKLTLGVVVGFALLEVLTLGFTTATVLFLALALFFAALEYPQQAAEAQAY